MKWIVRIFLIVSFGVFTTSTTKYQRLISQGIQKAQKRKSHTAWIFDLDWVVKPDKRHLEHLGFESQDEILHVPVQKHVHVPMVIKVPRTVEVEQASRVAVGVACELCWYAVQLA